MTMTNTTDKEKFLPNKRYDIILFNRAVTIDRVIWNTGRTGRFGGGWTSKIGVMWAKGGIVFQLGVIGIRIDFAQMDYSTVNPPKWKLFKLVRTELKR